MYALLGRSSSPSSESGGRQTTAVQSESELRLLVRMALADREMSSTEMKLLRRAAKHVGLDRKQLHGVIRDVRRGARSRAQSGD